MAEKSEFLTLCEIIEKAKEAYHAELDKRNIEGACYPVRITVWLASEAEGFRPIKKLVEIDEREAGSEGKG